ncbi:MAG TPA: substrate-binding domain-containing protein, partial [Xanthobacteraceae bacterium]|nr:substrate-binding domain-containing protein [Xanthobacteraceae bacterium]
MSTWSKIAVWAAAGYLSTLITGSAAIAAEITVVSTAGPMPEMMGALVPMFEQASGHKVTIKFQGAPQTMNQLKEGASIDLVIAGDDVIDELVKNGAVGGSSKIMLSRVGVAVRAGAPKPDIGSADAFKAALIAAKSVAYSQGASGQHFATVIARLGLVDTLKSKTIIVQGKPVGAAVAAGEAEIGVQQVAELLPVSGIDFVGPLPGNLQKIIVYAAAVPVKAKEPEAATAL